MVTRTPIALITGSLGSGKTTLLRRILESPGDRIAILMNEFGELAIDSTIIRGKDIDIIELVGGCVCCSLTGEFEAAVNEIIGRARPQLIIVEATGVAESDALVYEVEDRLPDIRLDAVVCIVDAYAAIKYPQVGYAARTQLASADILLINKVDLIRPDAVDSVIAQVRKYNSRAVVVETVRCDAPPDLLFSPQPGRRVAPEPLPRAEKFEAFSFTTLRTFDRAKFEQFLAAIPESVFRAKGFLRFPDQCMLFNYVAGRVEFEAFDAGTTQLVFIGPSVGDDREAIERALRECEA